jgi:hypothetical protein
VNGTDKQIGLIERLFWRIFAPFEFTLTVGVGMVLYLFGALYFACCIFVTALGGLFRRASALLGQRFGKGRVYAAAATGKMGAPPSLSEIIARRAGVTRQRSNSWLN